MVTTCRSNIPSGTRHACVLQEEISTAIQLSQVVKYRLVSIGLTDQYDPEKHLTGRFNKL